jgi:hypothetical protein
MAGSPVYEILQVPQKQEPEGILMVRGGGKMG